MANKKKQYVTKLIKILEFILAFSGHSKTWQYGMLQTCLLNHCLQRAQKEVPSDFFECAKKTDKEFLKHTVTVRKHGSAT
jgi:hypothetical protein